MNTGDHCTISPHIIAVISAVEIEPAAADHIAFFIKIIFFAVYRDPSGLLLPVCSCTGRIDVIFADPGGFRELSGAVEVIIFAADANPFALDCAAVRLEIIRIISDCDFGIHDFFPGGRIEVVQSAFDCI